MVRVSVVERTRVPFVPETVTVNVPSDAVELADSVRVEVVEPSAGGVTGLGVKAPVTPLGRPERLRLTG